MGPRFALNPDAIAAHDWPALVADGSLARLSLDVGQVNAAFDAHPDPRAAQRLLTEPPDTPFIGIFAAQISQPSLAERLLDAEAQVELTAWLDEGVHALWLGARGLYSFKGRNYLHGGVFERIELVQGDLSIRFREEDHRALAGLDLPCAPNLTELDLFRIPADSGFDLTQAWCLQLLVQRNVTGVERIFTFFDLAYQLPAPFLRELSRAATGGCPSCCLRCRFVCRTVHRAVFLPLSVPPWCRTGDPGTHPHVCSVIDPRSGLADALTTAACVLSRAEIETMMAASLAAEIVALS